MFIENFNGINNIEKSIKSENISKEDKRGKFIFLSRLIINFFLSFILIVNFFIMLNSFTTWKLLFFITIWSFWSNTFYIISITIIDLCLYNNVKKCEKFNYLIRNYFLRIFFPFSIGIVIIDWELVLLGEKYIDVEYTVLEFCKRFFIHGLVLIFIFFDIFTAPHLDKNQNYKNDLLIISILTVLHFSIVIICKEYLDIYQWNFLIFADFRQIIAAFIIIYLIILNGYVILYLISDNFFTKENENNKNKRNEKYIYKENEFKENDEKRKKNKEIKKNENKVKKEENNKKKKNKEINGKEEKSNEDGQNIEIIIKKRRLIN